MSDTKKIEELTKRLDELESKLGALPKEKKERKKRAPTEWDKYLKANRKRIQEENPGASFGEITKLCSVEYKKSKE